MTSVDRRIGDSIGGYRVVGVLGRGGSGAVYQVTDEAGTPAALKLVDARADAVAATRLEREVAALQSLRHEAVPRVIDAELDADETFVVFELVPGQSIFHYVQEHGPLQGEQLASFAERMASALEAAHAAGVVHRDVTPSNIMMGPDGPVLIDFGLSHREDDDRLTRDGLVSGTAGYVAPEVIDGADPGPVADDWSWAATVAYAMSATAPFGSGSKAIGRTLEGDLTIAQVPGAEAVAAALGRDVSKRPGMRDVVAALRGATTVLERDGGEHDLAPTAVMAAAAPSGTHFVDVTAVQAADAGEGWDTATSGALLPAGEDEFAVDDEFGDEAPDSEPLEVPAPTRRTVLFAWGLALAASAAIAPVIAFGAAVLLAIVARTSYRRNQALRATRSRKGVRRGDTVVHTIGLPWYLLRSAAEAIPSVLLAAAAGVGTAAAGWWLVSSQNVAPGTPAGQAWGHALALMAGGAIALVMLAWGPLTAGTRTGAHQVAAAIAPTRGISTLWVVIALVIVGIVAVATYLQADIWWWPLPPVPDTA